mgnify:CR=1 FL=1
MAPMTSWLFVLVAYLIGWMRKKKPVEANAAPAGADAPPPA